MNAGRRTKRWMMSIAWVFAVSMLSASARGEMSRYVGDGERCDFVIELQDGTATLYIARKPTNEPLSDLKPELVPEHGEGEKVHFARTDSAGVYRATFTGEELPEGHLVVTIDGEKNVVEAHEEGHEGHEHGEGGHEEHGHEGHGWIPEWAREALLMVGGVAVGLLGAIMWRRGRERGWRFRWRFWRAGVWIVAALTCAAPRAFGGDGHNHGEVEIGGAGKGGTAVVVSKKSQFLIELRTVAARRTDVAEALLTFGHVGPKPSQDSYVRSPIPGFLRHVTTIAWGSKVRRGERLAMVDGISAIGINAPVDGILMESTAVEGARVDAGEKLFRVVNMSSLWVDAEVFQKDLPQLRQATGVAIQIDGGYPPMRGKLSGAQTVVDENTLTAKVYVEIDNSTENIPLGVVAHVAFELPGRSSTGFVLPKSALLDRGGERILFVQTGPETFEAKSVSANPGTQLGTVVVTNGIEEGDRVVVSGNYQLLVGAK